MSGCSWCRHVIIAPGADAAARGAALDGVFRYRWVEDASRAGAAETSHVVAPPNITFLNETVRIGDDQATRGANARDAYEYTVRVQTYVLVVGTLESSSGS